MKKIFVAKLALAGVVGVAAALAAGSASAADCSACHTMHNSQGGQPMRFDTGDTPLPILLRDDCIGCHSGLNTAASVVNTPPRVIATALPTYSGLDANGAANTTLAGGDFYWVAGTTGLDAKGHNVVLVSDPDGTLSAPPGGSAPAQVECAGTSGCHGNPATANPLASLEGAHHSLHGNGVAQTTANTVGNSFRYLLGTQGSEDTDWQFTESSTDHNQYVGLARTLANNTVDARTTISGLCARCHGAYHNSAGGDDTFGINEDNTNFANGQWIRHPTDYAMPLAGEYAGYGSYEPETPVGRLAANIEVGSDGDAGAGNRIVLCVSCHRAHGSPYDDMLRWTYSAMQVGAGVTHGCMNCHTAK